MSYPKQAPRREIRTEAEGLCNDNTYSTYAELGTREATGFGGTARPSKPSPPDCGLNPLRRYEPIVAAP